MEYSLLHFHCSKWVIVVVVVVLGDEREDTFGIEFTFRNRGNSYKLVMKMAIYSLTT